MSQYLIDTNLLSEPLKPQPNPNVVAITQQYSDNIAIAAITWSEILFGCYRLPPSRRREEIEAYLQDVKDTFPILPYTMEAAEWHATERARLRAIGRTPPRWTNCRDRLHQQSNPRHQQRLRGCLKSRSRSNFMPSASPSCESSRDR